MSSIWANVGGTWQLQAPVGFPDEAALHTLVQDAPNVLPLAGASELIVLGREVSLGGNYADLIAVEPSGRLAVVEIKLGANSESRRAVVAQVLTYAAVLRGLTLESLESDILQPHLVKLGHESITSMVEANSSPGTFKLADFDAGIRESLALGAFRLVLVLDSAPSELIRLVGYLDAVADKLQLDLITLASYDIGGAQVVVPHRLDEAKPVETPQLKRTTSADKTQFADGSDEFERSIGLANPDFKGRLTEMLQWARDLEQDGLTRLITTIGASRWMLNLTVPGQNRTGLIGIWNERGASIQYNRSVFERLCPIALGRIEVLVAPKPIGKGTTSSAWNDEIKSALRSAYEEASQAH